MHLPRVCSKGELQTKGALSVTSGKQQCTLVTLEAWWPPSWLYRVQHINQLLQGSREAGQHTGHSELVLANTVTILTLQTVHVLVTLKFSARKFC